MQHCCPSLTPCMPSKERKCPRETVASPARSLCLSAANLVSHSHAGPPTTASESHGEQCTWGAKRQVVQRLVDDL